MNKKIYLILNEVGVPCDLKGRSYIQTALEIICEKGKISMTKMLYPEIAKRHMTTPSKVERAIRHAVEKVFYNTDENILEKYFGNTVDIDSGKLNNSQFIYALSEYLKYCDE